MRHIRIPFLVVALSLMLTGMAFAIDISGGLSSWISTGFDGFPAGTQIPGLLVGGVGGGGPGRGDVLLGPLYDVRNLTDPGLPGAAGTTAHAQYTMIAIVNTDAVNWVVARLRFREYKRSVEVLDIDIPLSPRDVWVGELSRLAAGGAVLNSPDNYIISAADPFPPGSTPFTMGAFPAGGYPLVPSYINDEATPALALARTEYGHFEFIGEENACLILTPSPFAGRLARAGTAQALGFCAAPPADRNVGNVLEGTAYIIRPDIAISHQYNMTALANFSVNPNGIYNTTASLLPNLFNDVQGGPNPLAPLNPGAGGFDNLEALLSKRFVDFQYVTGTDAATGTPMSTSLVVTFPTKFYHYLHISPFTNAGAFYTASAAPLQPFTGLRETLGDGVRTPAIAVPEAVGEVVRCSIWDRLEHALTPPVVSPALACRLPYEVNVAGLYPVDPPVVGFRNNMAIQTANASAVPAQTYYSGWGRIDLSPPIIPVMPGDTRTIRQGKGFISPAPPMTLPAPILFNFFNNFMTAYRGLPAIGIVMTEFYNGTVSGYYGNTVPWQYGVDWACQTCVPPITFTPFTGNPGDGPLF